MAIIPPERRKVVANTRNVATLRGKQERNKCRSLRLTESGHLNDGRCDTGKSFAFFIGIIICLCVIFF